MPPVIKLQKGLDVPLNGSAQKVLTEAPPPKTISIKPTDFRGLTPKLLVKEGEVVAAGTPLFKDKHRPRIWFTAPVGGVVGAIIRGEKRKIEEIRIECIDNPPEPLSFKPEKMMREQIIKTLLQSGCWPYIKQRPYGIIAHPDSTPKAIFISAFDSAPLAPDLDFILTGQLTDLQRGIDVLNRLSPNGIYWGVRNHTPETSAVYKVKNVHTVLFEGKHPAGNVGVQMHHITPISKGEIAWTIDPQSVIIIGRLFGTGVLDTRKIVALTGPSLLQPCYVSLLPGTPLNSLLQIGPHNPQVRYISGNCLTGDDVGFNGALGFYHQQITLLPEGDHRELFGWAKPIRNKTFSISRTYLSWLYPKKRYALDTNTNGGVRAFVMGDVYKKVLPMDIYPIYLFKAILAQDIEKMEALGIYEVVEEDFALCDFVCPSKIDIQEIIANGIDLMIKEMS